MQLSWIPSSRCIAQHIPLLIIFHVYRYDTYSNLPSQVWHSIRMLLLQCCHRSGSIQFGPERQVCGVVCNSCKSGTSQNRNRPYDHVYPSQPFLIHTWLFCVTQQRLHKSSSRLVSFYLRAPVLSSVVWSKLNGCIWKNAVLTAM